MTSEVTATPTPAATPVSEPRRLATGTYIVRNSNSGDGKLQIDNGLTQDAAVLLAPELSSKAVISVYMQSGDEFTITGIPDGNYIVYYRIGTDWDSDMDKFTQPGQNGRFEDTLNFETTSDKYTTYELTLQPVEGGTAETYEVNDANMPST
ncbi:MAG TPA: hypothetical protein VK436_16675 [Methanocella sp.]|nr:hypothetical protein [Methanocella sp.]